MKALKKIDLYEAYLKGPAWLRSAPPHEQVEVAELILLDGDYPLEVKVNSLVILVYKCIEAKWYRKAVSYKKKVLVYSDEIFEKICEEGVFEGVRQDPGQLYISLLSSLRHINVLEKDLSFVDAKKIKDFMESDNILAPSYSLNIGKSLLPYSYVLFRAGKKSEFFRLVEDSYAYFIDVINKNDAENIPSSSHFGDMISLAACLKIMLAGREWALGQRERKDVFDPSRIAKVCSRVADTTFIKKYQELLSNA